MADINYTTGPWTLSDVGRCYYNGVTFSPSFHTQINGKMIKDAANRTVCYMEYELTIDGYVTLNAGSSDINSTMDTLRQRLSEQAGFLSYTGRGFDLIVNGSRAANKAQQLAGIRGRQTATDAAWGPVPEILEFQPLGAGRSAKVVWKVTVRIPEVSGKGSRNTLLQFNMETEVSYGEDYYSSLSIKGTMEIPLTRPTVSTRISTRTVDDVRNELNRRIFANLDLERFRIVNRSYQISRDKRTMEFNIQLEEKPYMDLPVGCTLARGGYSVRPSHAGPGLCNWMCTLRATYTVAADRPRRTAWVAFLYMLRLRMHQSQLGNVPPVNGNQNPFVNFARPVIQAAIPLATIPFLMADVANALRRNTAQQRAAQRAWLIDFNFDEGLYLDSKTVSFSATWRLITTFSHILLASGIWRKLPETILNGQNLWAIDMANINGSTSWLQNRLDASKDIIVDFGGG